VTNICASLTAEDAEDDNANPESDDEDSILEGDTGEPEIDISEPAVERSSGFTQQPTDVLPSCILADVFHEIDKVSLQD
jgi:hypothetical protein